MFGNKTPKQTGKIHATKAGRAFDDIMRELDRGRDQVGAKRDQKNGGRK